jgi:hypothetical protein
MRRLKLQMAHASRSRAADRSPANGITMTWIPRPMRIILPLLLALLLAGCELITGVHKDLHVGSIGYPDDLAIQIPEAARVGEPFTVTVRTFGGNGCWERHRTDVSVSGLAATIIPIDAHVRRRGTMCTQAIIDIIHEATIRFDEAGTAAVEIQGRDGTAVRTVAVE